MKFIRIGLFFLSLSSLILANDKPLKDNRDKITKIFGYRENKEGIWNKEANAKVWWEKCDIIAIVEQNSLTKAILDDNIEQVKKAVAQGCDVNIVISKSYMKGPVTPLKIAAVCGNPEIVQFLLNSGAALKKTGRSLHPTGPLAIAINQGNKEVAQVLLSAGVPVYNDYYLRCAMAEEDVGMVDLLLAHGAKIDHCVGSYPTWSSMLIKKGLGGKMMNTIRSRVGIWPIIRCKAYDVWSATVCLFFYPPVFFMLPVLGSAKNKLPLSLALSGIVVAATVLTY